MMRQDTRQSIYDAMAALWRSAPFLPREKKTLSRIASANQARHNRRVKARNRRNRKQARKLHQRERRH